jgi:ribosomal protein S18 acetylase RimI-like enzyme
MRPGAVGIAPATPEAADALTELARAAKASWGYAKTDLAAWAPQLTITREYIRAHRVYRADADGRLVGTCALEDRGDHWRLEHVWVAPTAQRRGVGRALVEHALAVVRATRPGVVRLDADPHAVGFYRRLGAREVGALAAPIAGEPTRTLPVLEFIVAATHIGRP